MSSLDDSIHSAICMSHVSQSSALSLIVLTPGGVQIAAGSRDKRGYTPGDPGAKPSLLRRLSDKSGLIIRLQFLIRSRHVLARTQDGLLLGQPHGQASLLLLARCAGHDLFLEVLGHLVLALLSLCLLDGLLVLLWGKLAPCVFMGVGGRGRYLLLVLILKAASTGSALLKPALVVVRVIAVERST